MIKFEVQWYRQWLQTVESAKTGLRASLLVRHPTTQQVYVNFDPMITATVLEAKRLARLQFNIPASVLELCSQHSTLLDLKATLTASLSTYYRTVKLIPALLQPIFRPRVVAIETALLPGLSTIPWIGSSAPSFVASIDSLISDFSSLLTVINDLLNVRVSTLFKQMSNPKFCELPDDKPISHSQLLDDTRRLSQQAGVVMQTKNLAIKSLVTEVLARSTVGYSTDELSKAQSAMTEFTEFYRHRVYLLVRDKVKESLNLIIKRLDYRMGAISADPNSSLSALFEAQIEYYYPDVVMTPSTDEFQLCIADCANAILGSANNITAWSGAKSLQVQILEEDGDVPRLCGILRSAIRAFAPDVAAFLKAYAVYTSYFELTKEHAITEFMHQKPTNEMITMEFDKYRAIQADISKIPHFRRIGPFQVATGPIKAVFSGKINEWTGELGHQVKVYAKLQLDDFVRSMSETTVGLKRTIHDIDSVSRTMNNLTLIRELDSSFLHRLQPIEQLYALLQDSNIEAEVQELVSDLPFHWDKIRVQASKVSSQLASQQEEYLKELIDLRTRLVADITEYITEYKSKGPQLPELGPRVASQRLRLFQASFDKVELKLEVCDAGDLVFGYTKTSLQFPELDSIKKELKLCQQLYGLYDQVLSDTGKWGAYLWEDLKLQDMIESVQQLQSKHRKLPRGLRDWPAYNTLKLLLEEWALALPLVEQLKHPAVSVRHFQLISDITKVHLDYEAHNFSLGNFMAVKPAAFLDDIEEVCLSAVKEAEILHRLKQLTDDWRDMIMELAPFKNRGDIILKGSTMVTINQALEDSLQTTTSLANNRYSAPYRTEIQAWLLDLNTAAEILDLLLQVQNLYIYLEQLELCSKSLGTYLESKRAIFPRFYFISDGPLLEILGQASDSHSIQPHLKSLFDNIAKLDFNAEIHDQIIGMNSSEGEKVLLMAPMLATGNVEIWLIQLEATMRQAMRGIIKLASQDVFEQPLLEFLLGYPAQVGLICLQILWTFMSEDALSRARSDKQILQITTKKILELLSTLVSKTTEMLTPMQRMNFESLITIQVHQFDVFNDLAKQKISSSVDFNWLKQSRFYWKNDQQNAVVSITDLDFVYSYEYLGVTERLVVTPLTDRCYITLGQALGMCMGGNPLGPAGTGKTETVKDMGRALGQYVLVFNCGAEMEFRGLGRIFKGLAQAGCWGCFDEFNRIELDVLSVAAQQIGCVLTAKKEHKQTFVFTDGSTVPLKPEFGLFITMNPGYAGRQELPENLKLTMRSIAMMVPDREIIIRVKLASSGFHQDVPLARKFFLLYKLCEEQLSKRVHYDFGLRNMLSVLRTCGAVKRASGGQSEISILMRVLRDMNLSKLVDEDEPLFLSLVNDVFPGVTVSLDSYPALQTAIAESTESLGYTNHPDWNLKLIQLYETQRVRHGIMILGPACSGKSSCIRTLMNAMGKTESPHREVRMNPKAITAAQMFGRLDVATNDWTDGIFSTLWRRIFKRPGEYCWLVLDGPVDTLWIESLNSVLDDNKILTLANGDRVPMSPTMKLVFEMSNLDNASPATVSRNGMVYMASSSLGWEPVLAAWLRGRNAKDASLINGLFKSTGQQLIDFVTMQCKQVMDSGPIMLIRSVLDLVSGVMPSSSHHATTQPKSLLKYLTFSIAWGLGGMLSVDDRRKLHSLIVELGQFDLPAIDPESDDTIFEYFIDEKVEWRKWEVPAWKFPKGGITDFSSLLIPTQDSVRYDAIINLIAKQGKSILLVGEPGSSKTVVVNNFLAKQSAEQYIAKTINFSSTTTAQHFQKIIDSSIEKRIGSTYGPPNGKSMIIFIDNISMPDFNAWGDQPTNELTRQVGQPIIS